MSNFNNIFEASEKGSIEDVKYFVEKECIDINEKDDIGWTALHYAANNNTNIEVLKYIISKGADVHSKSNTGKTPLFAAAQGCTNVEFFKYLVSKGANLNDKNNAGVTILHDAAGYNSNVEVLKYLVSNGADINAENNTGCIPIHTAAQLNTNVKIIEYLISQGSDVNLEEQNDLTPLSFSILNKNIEITKFLISKGADVNKHGSKYGCTSLHMATMDGQVQYAKTLIAAGADVNAIDINGKTPLFLTVLGMGNDNFPNGIIELVKTYISAGADVNLKEKEGVSIFFMAIQNNLIDVIKLMISAGADVNAKVTNGNPLLQYFIVDKKPEIAKILISAGADVNAKSNDGYPMLCNATLFNELETFKALLKSGADINAITPDGESVVHYVANLANSVYGSKEKFEMVECLKELKPNLIDYLQSGKTYVQNNEYDKAIDVFNEAILLYPNIGNIYSMRAVTYFNKKKLDQAFSDYNEAIRLDQNCISAYVGLGSLYFEKNEFDKAIIEFEKALELNPNDNKVKSFIEESKRQKKPTPTSAMLYLKNVSKLFKDKKSSDGFRAFTNINLAISHKEFVVIKGYNGCGKSVLLRMIAGYESISSGEITLDGEKINNYPVLSRNICMIPQNYKKDDNNSKLPLIGQLNSKTRLNNGALALQMSVYQNIAYDLEFKKVPKVEIQRRVNDAARLFDIEKMLDRKIIDLSSFQQFRVALARAIVRNPAIYLFDDILADVDSNDRVQMTEEVSDLHLRLNATIIYTTSDVNDILISKANRVIEMKDGMLI